jgi:DNA repair protein RecO
MLIKDSGIVLAVRRTGETSLTVLFLGRGSGKVRLLAKGAMSAKHPTRGALEPGNEIEIVCYHREGQATHYLKEASLVGRPAAGRDSLPHLAANLAALELLDQVCVPGASLDDAIVDTASEYLSASKGADPMLVFLAFAIRLLGALGVSPDTVGCVRCGAAPDDGMYSPRDGVSYCAEHRAPLAESVPLTAEVVSAAARCVDVPYESIARDLVSKAVRKELGRLVHWTYTYHVQGYHLPRSLSLI